MYMLFPHINCAKRSYMVMARTPSTRYAHQRRVKNYGQIPLPLDQRTASSWPTGSPLLTSRWWMALPSEHKQRWTEELPTLPSDAETVAGDITRTFAKSTLTPGTRLDLYKSLKALSWDLILGVFLGLGRTMDQKFKAMETGQEALLRGQSSLFPVSINTSFCRS